MMGYLVHGLRSCLVQATHPRRSFFYACGQDCCLAAELPARLQPNSLGPAAPLHVAFPIGAASPRPARMPSEASTGKDVALELGDVKAAEGADRCICGEATSDAGANVACFASLVYDGNRLGTQMVAFLV